MKIRTVLVVATPVGGRDSYDFVMEILPGKNRYWIDDEEVHETDFDRALKLCEAGRRQ